MQRGLWEMTGAAEACGPCFSRRLSDGDSGNKLQVTASYKGNVVWRSREGMCTTPPQEMSA